MNENLPNTRPKTVEVLLSAPNIRKRFDDILGKKAAGFVSSIISAVNQNPELKKVDPMTVISASAIAASLDLPINPSLGFAHIVPYKDRAQFQMGWRGYVQLAQRTGLFRTINVAIVREGELKQYDKFTGEMEFDEKLKKSDQVIGYVAYFRLLNGFEKYFYMTVEEVRDHAKRYSRAYDKKESRWQLDFDAMALKTVIKLLLNRWAPLSVDMQIAIHADQAVIRESESGEIVYEYDDTPESVIQPDPSEFDKKLVGIEIDKGLLDQYLGEIAKTHETTVEKIKIAAVSQFGEFLESFYKWAKKKKSKRETITCPNTNQPVTEQYCGECVDRKGCPTWG